MAVVEYESGAAFPGVIGRTAEESSPAWPAPVRAREGARFDQDRPVLRPTAAGAVRTVAAAVPPEGALPAGEPPAETAATPPTAAMAARPMPAVIGRGCRICYLMVTLIISVY